MLLMNAFIKEDDPLLRQEAEEVSFPLDEEEQKLVEEMREFLINSQDEELAKEYNLRPGVGLAAPQIGHSKQIFAVYITSENPETKEKEIELDEIIINPKITRHSVKKVALKEGEGCLSVPREVPGLVERPQRLTLTYYTPSGERKELKLKDYQAVVVAHEMDHLKGILFYDHINPVDPWHHEPDVTLI